MASQRGQVRRLIEPTQTAGVELRPGHERKSTFGRTHTKTLESKGRRAACGWCSKHALPQPRPLFLSPRQLVSFLLFPSLIINLQRIHRICDMLYK